MKRNIKDIKGYTIGATDGEIGTVKEFYFDDESFTVRYVIVKTGSWLFGREVLISTQAIIRPNWQEGSLPVNLTREQIKNSPDVDMEKPVSRQQEIKLYSYYGWDNYWGAGNLWAGGMGVTGMMGAGAGTLPIEAAVENNANDSVSDNSGDPHLRSSAAVTGYNIKATDGQIGDVEDFIIDDTTWKISHIVVDTGNWLAGKKVIVSPRSIKEIRWETSEVFVNATVDEVKNSPEYDANSK